MEEQKYSIVQQMLQAAQQTTHVCCTEAQGVQGGSDLKHPPKFDPTGDGVQRGSDLKHPPKFDPTGDEVQGGSDLKPLPKFDPAGDADALEKAIHAKDKGIIIDILPKRTNEQIQEIKASYQKKTGKGLDEALKKALSGELEDVILALMKTPAQFDAQELKAATKGLGTTEDTLIEILVTRSNSQIKDIKQNYKAEYKTDLVDDITDDTSGDFQKALLALLKGTRSEECYVREDQADKDARELFEAGENQKKADTSVFIKIFTERSFTHLKQVFKNYAKYSKHDVNKTMDLKMKGDIEKCLVAIAKVVVNKPGYFAEKLNLAMKGLGTREKVINRILVSQRGAGMKDIKTQFKQNTGRSLRDALMDETKGEYETVLVDLCGHDE